MPRPRQPSQPDSAADQAAELSQTTSPPQPDAPASSAGSSAAADPFVADPGSFDPDDPAAHQEDAEGGLTAPEDDTLELIAWTPERVRRLLTLQGTLTHTFAGVGEQDWIWQPHELDAVCPALADYANRVPALAAMAHLSDEAAIVAGFTSYALRSWRERVRVLRARQEQAAQPVTGRAPADEPTDPAAVEWSVQPS